MKFKRTIKWANGDPDYVAEEPVESFHSSDQIRIGLEWGTISKATLETPNGDVIIYERE
jgi:hypothetical protein